MRDWRLETPVAVACILAGAALLIGTLALVPGEAKNDTRSYLAIFTLLAGLALLGCGVFGAGHTIDKSGAPASRSPRE